MEGEAIELERAWPLAPGKSLQPPFKPFLQNRFWVDLVVQSEPGGLWSEEIGRQNAWAPAGKATLRVLNCV